MENKNEATPRFLNAYYYSFKPTGDDKIDAILESVAMAGKSFHSTSEWSEKNDWLNDGMSYVELIQKTANEAALASQGQPEKVTIDDFIIFYASVISGSPRSTTPKELGKIAAKEFLDQYPNGLIITEDKT